MVWLAAGGTTIILGYIAYRYCLVPSTTLPQTVPTVPGIQANPKFLITEGPADGDPSDDQTGEDENEVQEAHDKPPTVQESRRYEATTTVRTAAVRSMPPPPPPIRSPSPTAPRRQPPTTSPSPLRPTNSTPRRPPPSAASSLRIPPTKVLSNSSMGPSSSLMPPPTKPSKKVMLAPGHSPMDWASLTANPTAKLRGQDVPDHLIRVTPSMLKQHTGRKGKDAWTAYQGKVYNITPYLDFHPGGVSEIMRGAGRDSATLFLEAHPWVNWEGMLSECTVGILVSEQERKEDGTSGGLDEMD